MDNLHIYNVNDEYDARKWWFVHGVVCFIRILIKSDKFASNYDPVNVLSGKGAINMIRNITDISDLAMAMLSKTDTPQTP